MADLSLASVNLAAGLKLKYLTVQPMVVDVVYPNASADLVKAVKGDKVIVQKIQGAVFDALGKSRKDFKSAVEDLDEAYGKKLPGDEKEAQERVKTLNTVCKQITEAQKGVAVKAALKEWETQKKKNKDLVKYDGLFAVRITLGVVGVGASLTHAIMSFGATSAVAIVSIAKTLVATAKDIHNHCREMAKTEEDIIETDEVLSKTWTDKSKTAGKIGRELATALGVPFVKSIGGLDNLLTEYNAKSARCDKKADALYAKAKELMKKIDETSPKAGPMMLKKLEDMGKKTTDLLDKVGDIVSASRKCDEFTANYRKRCNIYRAMEGKALTITGKGTNIATLAGGAAATADTIVLIAQSLA